MISLKKDEGWKNDVAKRFNISNPNEIEKYLDDFTLDMNVRGREEEHRDAHDFKSHFCDWLRKELMSQTKGISRIQRANKSSPSLTNDELKKLEAEDIRKKEEEKRLHEMQLDWNKVQSLLSWRREALKKNDFNGARVYEDSIVALCNKNGWEIEK